MEALPQAGLELPAAIISAVRALAERGHESFVVGETLAALLAGESPPGWALATSASAEEIASCFEHAFPVRAGGLAFVLPTAAGPLELASHRNGPRIEDDLAHRDFSLHAMAYSPLERRLVDPWNGRADLAAGRLRAVGDPDARLEEEPLRALRAARLVACHAHTPDAGLEAALARQPLQALRAESAAGLRRELTRLLLAPHAGSGLALLRRTGREEALVTGTRDDAAALVDAMPRDLALRLVAWLRGSGGARTLRRLRFSPPLVDRVLRLLRLHPIEQSVEPLRPSVLRRFCRRLDAADLAALLELRERELELAEAAGEASAKARAALVALRNALAELAAGEQARQATPVLAIGGSEVMACLGIEAGPRVGLALRQLRSAIVADPAANTPDQLCKLLRAWAERPAADRSMPAC